MNKEILVNRIVGFYLETSLLDESRLSKEELAAQITSCLKKAEHLETIINTITLRARCHRNYDAKKLIEMLVELERIRLHLEYKGSAKVS